MTVAQMFPGHAGARVEKGSTMEDYKPGDAVLRHGYTLHALDRVTRWAVRMHRRKGFYRGSEDYDIAYGAVAVALYAAEEPPGDLALMQAGERALEAEVRTDLRAHGRRQNGDPVPAFHRYWWGQRATQFPDDRIVEALALVEILPTLTPRQSQALVAFASLVASALGVSVKTAENHLSRGRAAFRQLWLEHETPVSYQDSEATCRNGHDRADSYLRAGHLVCHTCELITKKRGRRIRRQRSTDASGAAA